MTSFLLQFFFFIPILLVVAAGELIRKRGNPVTSSHRYFLFLVWTSLIAWSLFTYTDWGTSAGSLGSLYNTMLAPLLIGVSSLTGSHGIYHRNGIYQWSYPPINICTNKNFWSIQYFPQ
jgi:hypothetical protein